MKTVNASTTPENIAEFFIDVEGDIFESSVDAKVCGIAGKVIVDGFYPGTIQQMMQSALEKYNAGSK